MRKEEKMADHVPTLARKVDKKLWKILPIQVNGNNMKEAEIQYNGGLPLFQIGSAKEQLQTPFGTSRYNSAIKNFSNVTDETDTEWTHFQEPGAKKGKGRSPTGKLQCTLAMSGWDEVGTQGYYAYQLFAGLEEVILQAMVEGDLFDWDVTPEMAKRMLKSFLNTQKPINEKTGKPYPPDVRCKIRWRLATTPRNVSLDGIPTGGDEKLTLTACVVDGDTGEVASNPFPFLQPRSGGVWIVKVNNLLFKKMEVNCTVDIIRAKLWKPRAFLSNTQFVVDDEDGAENDQEMADVAAAVQFAEETV
jgi:hypothetical protein